jgi:Glycosyltransferase family 87
MDYGSAMLGEQATDRHDATLRTAIWLVLVGASVAIWLIAVRTFGFDPGVQGSDAWNYLAAGERLNAGHPLYALSAGDRPTQIVPPYWTVPLLSPPPIAVLWRPLALLGDLAMTLWASAGLALTVGTAAWLLARGGLVVAAIVALFALALAEQSLAGNVNAFLFLILTLAWAGRDRWRLVGGLLAVAIAIKLTPAILLIWLASTGRWRAVGGALLGLAVIALVSLAGAGIQNHLDWLASVPGAVPVPTSVAGLTGLPSTLVIAGVVLGVLGISRLGDERLTFSAAVVGTALASPALYLGTLGIAAAAAAAWVAPEAGALSLLRPRRG